MTNSQRNRRNFLSSIAILSAGTAFGSTIKHFSAPASDASNDLQKQWTAFWKKSGGQVFYSSTDLDSSTTKKITKGHLYKYGAIIYFPKENILAQPTWIFWKNGGTKAADMALTLFENDHSFKKIICYNRYEMEALYRLSNEADPAQLLLASFNNSKPVTGASAGIIKSKTIVKQNSQIQDISYYKGQVLVFQDKLIHHT